MSVSRRNFLRGAAAVVAAPAIVRAANLMPVHSFDPMPKLWGDGIHDDTAALQAMICRAERSGKPAILPSGTFRISDTLHFRNPHGVEWSDAHIIGGDLPHGACAVHLHDAVRQAHFTSITMRRA